MMNKKLLLFLFSVVLGAFVYFSFLYTIHAQDTSPLSPKETLIQAIQNRAKADAEMGKPPEGLSGLDFLFGKEAETAGMSNLEIVQIYEEAYKAAQVPPDPLKDLFKNFFRVENLGWLAAIIAFILFLLRKKLEVWITKIFNWLTEAVYRRVAGFRPFWTIALRRYRKALKRKYRKLKIPFRPERPLQMKDVYVPLRAIGGSSREEVGAYQAVQSHRWLVVLGAPGSGKTMLLRNLARAFALVAADPRDRGKELFAFIKENLSDPDKYVAAATILTFTNLPQAANALVEKSLKGKYLHPYLVKMGDLAVQAISDKQYHNQQWVMDILYEIGTPHAALLLVPLLWDDNELVPYHAAWRLAAMLNKPNVDSALRLFELTQKHRKEKQIEWVWAPFKEPVGSSLPVIAGRIAYLLNTASAETIPDNTSYVYDPRLVIPLCAVAARDGRIKAIDKKINKELKEELEQIEKSVLVKDIKQKTTSNLAFKAFIEDHKNKISDDSVWHSLFMGIPELLEFKLLRCLIRNDPIPAKEDWKNVLQPSSYVFEESWQKRCAWLLFLFLCLLNIGSLAVEIFLSFQFLKWEYLLPISGLFIMCIILWVMWRKEFKLKIYNVIYYYFIAGIGLSFGVIIYIISTNWIVGIVLGCIFSIIFSLLNIIYIIPQNIIDGNFFSTVGSGIGIVISIVIGIVGGIVVGSIVSGIVGGIVGIGVGIGVGIVSGGIFGFCILIGVYIVDEYGVGGIFGIYVVVGFCSCVIDIILIYQPTNLLYKLWNWPGFVMFWFVYLAAISFITWHANRKDRKSRNPFYGLLEAESFQTTDSTISPLFKYRQKFRK